MTSRFGVVGSPIKHSLSPAIHRAAYSALGFDFSYDRYEVSQGDLSNFLSSEPLAGLSVTMPLKIEAFAFSDKHDESAGKTSVANTLVRENDYWIGHNTDVAGFERILGKCPNPEKIAIIGSGATARSAALAIANRFPDANISVIGRSDSSVDTLVKLAREFAVEAIAAELSLASLEGQDIVISTVPAGALGELWNQLAEQGAGRRGVLIDVAYDPWPSTAARLWGSTSVSGIELLIWQAIGQIELFAQAQGESVMLSSQGLYEVMRSAISDPAEPK